MSTWLGSRGGAAVIAASLWLFGGVPSVFAASKPIEQLPHDVARWSTLWTAVPKEMYAVGEAHGPLAALTWGPVQGTATLVHSVATEVWNTAKPDKRTPSSKGKRPIGVIFQYEF